MPRFVLLAALLFAASASAQPVEYLLDDGDGDVNQGPPSSFDPDMLWGNYFLTEPGGEIITHISVAFGPTFPSLEDGPVTFWLLDDPDADLDPRNAISLTSVQATPDVFNDAFFTVEIPPTEVSDAFFVGVSAFLQGGKDRPARVDRDDDGDQSWFFYDGDISAVIDDLGSAAFGTRMDDPEFVIFPGAFMIRAIGEPRPVSAEAPVVPPAVTLEAPYPNPLRSETTLAFYLPGASHVTAAVYDVTGRRVATLADRPYAAGAHRLVWSAAGLAAGAYVVHIEAGETRSTQRLTVLP